MAAEQAGFQFNTETGLYENVAADQQMRINDTRCAFRFVTFADGAEGPLLVQRFGDAAFDAATNTQRDISADLGREDLNNGLLRVAVRLDI